MYRLFSIAIILICAISCSVVDSHKMLKDVESYIMERPDSALSVLESIDRDALVTHRNKAHHALLYAMALDKNFIDVTDDSIAKVAVDYYQKRGPKSSRARALYYLGKSYYYNKEYDKAILEFSKAERVAVGCDSLYLGMIYFAKSQVYNKTYNSLQELLYSQNAYNVFVLTNSFSYVRPALYRLAVSYHNIDNYFQAAEEYTKVIADSNIVDYFYVQSLLGKAHSMIEMENVDYFKVAQLFQQVYDMRPDEMYEQDNWAWAYSLYQVGESERAKAIINEIDITDELIANFWKSRILSFLGDYKTALEYEILAAKHQNQIVEDVLAESLETYQKDFYQSQLDAASYKVKMRTKLLAIVIICCLLLTGMIYLVVLNYLKKQKDEKEQLKGKNFAFQFMLN